MKNDRSTRRVDAATPRPPRELREVARLQQLVPIACVLAQALDHDGARRHVDAERQSLGGEDDLDQAASEDILNGLLERRDHAGVVGCHPPGEPLPERFVAEHFEVV